MDPRLIDLYNDELLHLRTEAAEFAREFPDRAARLSLDQNRAERVEDPYVERLLEGVAFLAARVRLKLEAQYPVFTQQLLEVLFPGWLAPSAAACVLRLDVDAGSGELLEGVVVPKRSVVVGSLRRNPDVRCEFETCRPVALWPLVIRKVQYVAARPELTAAVFADTRPSSSLRVELELLGEALDFSELPLDTLPLFITKSDAFGLQLMELLAGRCIAVAASADPSGRRVDAWLAADDVRQLGFDDDEAMFPQTSRGLTGFRVLKEYAALPDKFRFVEVGGLRKVLSVIKGRRLFLTFYFSGVFPRLESATKADSLALFCVPAVNLREVVLDRVEVTPGRTEFHLVADRMRPRAKEIVQIVELRAGGSGGERSFQPVFESVSSGRLTTSSYYTTRRERRLLTQTETMGQAITYPGSELFVSLTEAGAAPYGSDLQFLSVRALCSSRDIPLTLRAQFSEAIYEFVDVFPVRSLDCVAGPSVPLAAPIEGFDPWLALSHLFVNHLSLFDDGPGQGAEALRAMLGLYATIPGHPLLRQAEGLLGVSARQITRRIQGGGPLAFGRGVEVELKMSDRAFDGGSPFMLAAVLEYFLAAHVSINSFVETTVELVDRAERLRWKSRFGRRPGF